MKNLLLITLTILFLSNKIPPRELLDNNQKLFATAKIWGFLKYYHPNVANGEFDWDDQLLRILPSIENATTRQELSTIYLAWIESLGGFRLCKKCNVTDDEQRHFEENFNLSWIEDDLLFTNELSEKLRYIEQNRYQGKPHYVALKGRPQTLVITNEKSYPNFDWTDKQLRLLSLFRYWNTIEYFYPHKYQLDTEWDEVFYEMLPKFSSPNSELEFHLAMMELVVKIEDSHGYFSTGLLKEHFGIKQIPAAFEIIDNNVIITHYYDDSLARLNDIRRGDIITKVEDIEVGDVLKQNLKYINGSNMGAKIKYAFGKILNGSTDSVEVEIMRGGKTETRQLARYSYSQFSFAGRRRDAWEILSNNIGYINLSTIDGKDLSQALNELTNTRSIILDLRNYPKGFYGDILKNYFGAKGTMLVKQINPNLQYPGKFILTEQSTRLVETKYNGQVILLVNEKTHSRAEYTALWIQNGYNVTTVGSQTSGAGGIMINQEFIGGYKSYFTSSGVFYPDMTPIQREGVKIDCEVKPTIDGIINSRDEVLEKAIELASR